MKAFLDKKLEKFLSRKLLVWITSTGLLLADAINGEQWVAVALIYIGLQGAADIAAKWKFGQQGN
tara:strand:- start:1334 stop:1528 length:195 start_codon:yes stop_codon:yes gene_type:complete